MIALELKTYTPKAAGVGRYSVQLVDKLLVRQNFNYFGFTSPQTAEQKFPLGNNQRFINQQSTVLRSLMIPFLYWNNKIKVLHTLDASTFYGLHLKTVKRVTTIHDLIVLKFPQYFTRKMGIVLKARFRHAINNSDYLIADSTSTKNDLLEYFPKLKEDRVAVIPLASSISKENCGDSIRSTFLNDMLKEGRSYFLSVATHEPRKNIKLVIEAFQTIRKRIDKKLMLVLVGKQGWLSQAAMHSKGELLENVICTGAISDQELKAWYKYAIALVYPSFYEGFGLPVLEAMAMACPVITSNVSSLPEVAGGAARLVDPYSLADLVGSMKEFIESETSRKKYKDLGLKQSAKFSWDKTAELTEEVYQRFI